jgi:hypothetical protein
MPDYWKTSPVKCLQCNHKWIAVFQGNHNVLECPQCGTQCSDITIIGLSNARFTAIT